MSISPGVPISCSSSSSITELLGALCDSCLSGVSWKRRALGSVTREGVRRALRKRAYGALLSKLFQEGPSKGALGCGLVASTPPRNKVLMISFDLRVSGCREEAERLEALLGMLGEGSSSGLGELDSALELLVQLAGSVAPPPASFSRDYMRRERPVLRRPPLGGYQSEELQQLEARAWALICREEWSALGALHGTLGLMDASPGSGLLVLGQGSEVEERFQKETRLSLFGALQHTRTSDLDIKLDLPPVPSNIEVTGLTIRVPPSVDQSEDEGFQSASNLTPDSQSEPSPCPELDVWEALRNFRPGRRRCWESVGCPPGRKEDPYLTEAGREAFDRLYRLWEGEMRLVSTATVSPPPPIPLHSQTQLVGHLLNVLIGVESATFPLNQACVQFDVRPGVCISGASPESVSRLLGELAQYGTHYLRLSQFSLQSPLNRGLVFQAFTGGLRRYLQYYRACVLCTPPSLSLLTIGFLFRKLGRQLRYLFELCCVDGATGVSKPTFPVGVKLLSYLYNEAQSNCSNENYPVLLSLLKSSCEPYTRFVSDWVYSGVFRDVYQEFMIQVNEDFLSFRDKHFWVQGYTLISQDVEECVPVFLRHIANDVYVCGKTINLLKICCPQHYICWSELPVPRIAVTFSLQEVEEIERDCAVYRGHMERIAKHSALSREEQALRTELARQELINQVRESTAKTLESIHGRQVSQRLAAEAEKRERFEELKRHLEAEQEWHSAAKRREQDDDFGFARELRDREKRLQALEEQLERKARKELIAQYSCLTEEAARRERRALWRVQRLQLDNARTQFLKEDQQLTEALLERYPLGQGKVPLNVLPFSAATYNPPQGPQAAENCLSEEEERTRESVDTESSPRFFSSAATPILSGDLDIQDFLPKTPQLPDNSQVDRALQDIGYDLPEASLPTQNQDYDFSAPYSPLTEGSARPRRVAATQPGLHGASLEVQELHGQPPDSDIPPNQHQSERPQQSAVVQGLSPEDSVRQTTSEQGAEQKDPTADTMRAVELSNQKAATQTQVEDPETISPVSAMETTPLPGTTHGHSSDSTLAVGCVVPGTEPVASPLPGSQYGHSSDSTLAVGCVVPGTEPVASPLPGSQYGHSSDSTLAVGCVVPGTEPVASPLPGSQYGHSSDSTLAVGCVVPGTEPAASQLPGSQYGHSSDSTLAVGCVVPGTEPVASPLPGSQYGHSSDSTLAVGCVVPGTEPVASPLPGSQYGHSSDSTLAVGCVVPGTEPVASPLPGSQYGHSSDSTLAVGCVVPGTEPVASPLPGSQYGHSSDSTLAVGCVVPGTEPVASPLPGSQYGHSSDSTLGVGCVVLAAEPVTSPISGSAHGHVSDSTLGMGCVVTRVWGPASSLPGVASDNASWTLEETAAVRQNLLAVVEEGSMSQECQGPKEGNPGEEQQLLETWSLGLGIFPGEGAELDYLLSLAAQYQVEQYQDDYSLLTSAPDSQLLQQVTRGPSGLPAEWSLRRATDATAVQLSEMVSLPVLMKHSVTTPLITHVSLVNKAAVDYFFVELGLERHFQALRHFLLMEDGEFAQSLSDLLFEKLGSGQTPGELLTPLVLNSILNKALQYSLHGHGELAAKFTFALRFVPETFHPHAPDVLHCLELRYKVDWPLNVIITDTCMNKYNRLFSFLLQLKHMVWTLRDVWFHLKRAALVKGAGRSAQFRQLQLYRHEMQHFVKVIQGYIANQILQVSWSEFTQKLGQASDLDAIHRTHADYLNRAICRGLLTEKAASVMNIIHTIFSLVLKFRAQLIAQPWSSQQGEAVHPSFVAMQQSYNTFKYYSHFLFKVVTKLVNKGYQPHLEDFLLRINFNNYYRDS